MSESQLRAVAAACAVVVTLTVVYFAAHKHKDDGSVAVSLERLAEKYAPLSGQWCLEQIGLPKDKWLCLMDKPAPR